MDNPELTAFLEIRGKQAAVASSLGVSKQTVNDWKRQGFIPAKHAAAFEALSGIARTRLCPSFAWAPPRKAKPTATEAVNG
jgi:DNA-binding transcriptional regulator YdaS (Cro superfamily)